MTAATDRDLLFGLLALQIGLIDQAQLVAAFQAWTLQKDQPLADHLVGRGAIDADDRAAVEALVARHVKKHGGSTAKSLAALPIGRSAQNSLGELHDLDIEGTLARVGTKAAANQTELDADRTATYSVGTATADGQRFRILRPHARGGLGAVFVALDEELHREVALKQILEKHADDPASRQRFLLEAEVTGGLEHPGIVPVYGLGSYPDGRPYYAMRFIRGDALKEAIEQFHADDRLKTDAGRRSLELRKFLRRFLDVCNAIDYAHSRGVLHRDIKPANIIVGKHGETLVVDWGLAKPLGRSERSLESGERTLLPTSASGSATTLPGSALGTPAYMSPEQSQGDLERLGPRSDVYSLGATLYCLLTGKPPFEGELADVIQRVQKGEVPTPRQLDPGIDRALEAICNKAMALKAADRYESPKALADDVERWMADEPVTAWREPPSQRARRWARQHRTGVTAAAIAVLVTLMGTAAVLAVQTRANRQLKLANTDLTVANNKVTKVNTELAAANERERARFALAQEAIRTFHTGVSEDILLKEAQFKALRSKLLREAREFYRKLEELLQGQSDRASRVALGRAYFEVGELTRQLDSMEEAQTIYRRALALFEALSGEYPADAESRRALALCLKSLALTLTAVGRDEDAHAAYGRARDLLRALAEADPDDRRRRDEWGDAELSYAATLSSSDRPATEVVEAIERARSILEGEMSADPQSLDSGRVRANVYQALAMALEDANRVEEALSAYKRASDLGEAMFRAKPDDLLIGQMLARNLGNMGVSLINHGRHAEALAAYERAQDVLKVARAANPTIVSLGTISAWIDGAAGHVLALLGRKEEALAALVRAREAREMAIKANPAVTRNREQLEWVLFQTADIHRAAGRMSDALEALERRRQVAAGLVESHPQNRDYRLTFASACTDLGDVQATMGKPAEAMESFEAALSVHRKLVEAEPPTASHRSNLAATFLLRGIALRRCGRPADAVQDFRQSISILQALAEPTPEDYYNMARAQSLMSGAAALPGSGLTTADSRAAALEAMTSLQLSVGAGWQDLALMRADTELAPIRSRPEFQLLMMDVAFPADPFSKDRDAVR
jgi:eukaryotic-like serine/threonine-protein kinase